MHLQSKLALKTFISYFVLKLNSFSRTCISGTQIKGSDKFAKFAKKNNFSCAESLRPLSLIYITKKPKTLYDFLMCLCCRC